MSYLDYANLLGWNWNKLLPRKPLPGMPPAAPRDHAIRALFDYLSLVVWRYETGDVSTEFTIDRNMMFEERPDDNTTMKLPCLVVDPQRGTHVDEKPILGPPAVHENRFDGKTALVEIGIYKETMHLEVWAASPTVRRAIVAGLDVALAPVASTWGLLLKLPNYFNSWAWFGLSATARLDDVQRESRRRYAVCEVDLWVPVLHQVPAGIFQPRVLSRIDEEGDWTEQG